MPFIAIAIIALLAIGGGASVAANSSLPGDALYNLKVGLNEKVESAFAFSDESKAQEDLEAIEERQTEAQKLQAQGKLTVEAKADINANIEAHTKAFATALANVKAQGSAEAATQLEAKLQAALDAAARASASANANADVNAEASHSQNDDGTSDQGHGDVKVDGGSGVRVDL